MIADSGEKQKATLRVFFGTLRKMGLTGCTGEPACGVKKQGVRPGRLRTN